jgi:hypothetical protein
VGGDIREGVNVRWPLAHRASGVPRNFFRVGDSTNSVEAGGGENGSGGGTPLFRGSTQFANE